MPYWFMYFLLNSTCIYIQHIDKFLHWMIIKEQYSYWICTASNLCYLCHFNQHIYHRLVIVNIYHTQNKHFKAMKVLNIYNQLNQINQSILKSNKLFYSKGNDTSALSENTLLIWLLAWNIIFRNWDQQLSQLVKLTLWRLVFFMWHLFSCSTCLKTLVHSTVCTGTKTILKESHANNKTPSARIIRIIALESLLDIFLDIFPPQSEEKRGEERCNKYSGTACNFLPVFQEMLVV